MKKVISVSNSMSTSRRKPRQWMRFQLVFIRWYEWVNTSRDPGNNFLSTAFSRFPKDLSPWGIPNEVTKAIPITIVITKQSPMYRRFLSCLAIQGDLSRNNNMIRATKWSIKWDLTNIRIRRQKQIQEWRRLIWTIRNTSRKINKLWKRLGKSKIVRFSARYTGIIGKLKPVFMMNVKVTKDIDACRIMNRESLSILSETDWITEQSFEEGD